MNDANPDDGFCCTKAVFDSVAGWWCPDHGDETGMRAGESEDPG